MIVMINDDDDAKVNDEDDNTRIRGIGMRISIGDEDCGFLPVSLTRERGLDVRVVTHLPPLSKTGVP
ncbi:hypothetical protein Tco_1065485 [Tanacetum coccineum]